MTNEIVRINHAGHAARVGALARRGFVGPHHPPSALHHYILFGPGHFRGQGNFKFHVGANFQGSVRADVHSRRAQVSRDPAVLPALFGFMYLDRQFQREAFSRPCFGHKTSSFLAILACKSQLHAASPAGVQNLPTSPYITDATSRESLVTAVIRVATRFPLGFGRAGTERNWVGEFSTAALSVT